MGLGTEPKKTSPGKGYEIIPPESPDEVNFPSITPEPTTEPRPTPLPSTPEVPQKEVMNPMSGVSEGIFLPFLPRHAPDPIKTSKYK